MKVSIITVNYNETAATAALLESIRQQHHADVEVIVVDNASRDNPLPYFQEKFPEAICIRSEQNLGFAGGNNLALPLASGAFLFFVNNDAEIAPDCIPAMLQLFENQPDAGIVSPLICYWPDPAQYPDTDLIQYAGMTAVSPFTGRNSTIGERSPDRGQFTQPQRTAYAHGAAMMVPRKVLEQVGPMWEGFFLYYEELDWCTRIKRAGYDVWMEPRARVWHKESLTLGKMGTVKTFYLNRNRILFMRRNVGIWSRLVFYIFLVIIAVPKNTIQYLLSADFQGCAAFFRGVFSGIKTASIDAPNPDRHL